MKKIPLLLILLLVSSPVHTAFDGPRVYWPLPKNTNIVSTHLVSGVANASWTNWNRIQAGVNIANDLYLLNYTRVQPVFGRTAYWQAFLPAGSLTTSSNLPMLTNSTAANGFGDPTIAATINVFGAPELAAKEYLRHDLDLSVNIGLNITMPLGEYDSDELLNIGSNQWKTRISVPIVKSLGRWVPGKRTTLELMPAITFISDNDSAQGNRIEQDPVTSLELHLTRDLTQKAFISLDYTRINGGDEQFISKSTGLSVRETDGLDANLLGITLGFEIEDNLHLFLTHIQTVAEDDDGLSLEASITKISLSWSWHDFFEKINEIKRN